jgi:hypothetical protein
MPLPLRTGATTFCDDIRTEANGKLMFLGVYASDIIVLSLPTVLQRLWAVTQIVTASDDPLEFLTPKLILPQGDEIALPRVSVPPHPEGTPDMTHRILTIRAPFQNVALGAIGRLRMRVVTEREEIHCGGLDVKTRELKASSPEAPLAAFVARVAKHSSAKERLGLLKQIAHAMGDVPVPIDAADGIVAIEPGKATLVFARSTPLSTEIEIANTPETIKWTIENRSRFGADVVFEDKTYVPDRLTFKLVPRKGKTRRTQ